MATILPESVRPHRAASPGIRSPANRRRPGGLRRNDHGYALASNSGGTRRYSLRYGTSRSRLVLKHRLWVAITWLVELLIAGGAAAWCGGRAALASFSIFHFLPGYRHELTEQLIAKVFGTSSERHPGAGADRALRAARSTQHAADVAKVWATVHAKLPQFRIVKLLHHRRQEVHHQRRPQHVRPRPGTGGHLGFGPQDPGRVVSPASRWRPRSRRTSKPGSTSYALLSEGGNSGGPSVLVETLFCALGALAVLAFVFASFLAFLPLVIAAVLLDPARRSCSFSG